MDNADNAEGGAEPLIVEAVHGDTGNHDTVVVPASNAPEDIAEAKLAEERVAREAVDQPPAPSTARTAATTSSGSSAQTLPVELHTVVHDAKVPEGPVPKNSPDAQLAPQVEKTTVPVVAGTALRSDPATSPEQQAEQLKHEDPEVVHHEVEKAKAEDREIHGHEPEGTIVDGIEDDQFWALLRRFDQEINHVLHPARSTPRNQPDLRMTHLPNVPFRSDTLKSNFERVIAAIGPPSTRGWREFLRITDWKTERKRTATYCIAYFTCWVFGYAAFAVLTFFAVLVCFPDTRRRLFPPPKPPAGKPLSATDPSGKKGDESLLGTTDGIKHRSRAEQAEEQAFETRAILEAYTARVIVGHQGDKGNGKIGAKDLDPDDEFDDHIIRDEYGDEIGRRETDLHPQSKREAHAEIGGQKVKANKEKDADKVARLETKRKRDAIVNKAAKATETGLGSIADTIEILQNAMSPPAPYPDYHARFKLAAAFLIAPAIAIQITPVWVWGKLFGFAFGAALWGRPLAASAAQKFVQLVPDWAELLDMRNSLLSNTPTNAQLILHILRVSEDLDLPIPAAPPPPLTGTPQEALKDTSPPVGPNEEDIAEEHKKVKKVATKTKSRLAGTFKKFSRKLAGFRGDVAVDGNVKSLGSNLQTRILNEKFGDESPDAYPCKLNNNRGHIVLDEHEKRVAWVPQSSKAAQHVWDIVDLVEVQKDFISVPRMALGWLGGAEVESLGISLRFADPEQQAVEIEGNDPDDESYHFKGVRRREQLFNRLIAMGPQRWEVL